MLGADKPAATDSWWDEVPSQNRALRLLESKWSWLVVGAMTFAIFELTSSSSIALAIGCLKFGWHDVWMAHKIKRADPDRIRGRTCAGFATAWGFVKVSLIATLMMFVVVFAEESAKGPAARPQGAPPPATFVTALLLSMAGFGVSSLICAGAVVSALRHGVKVWVGGRVNRANVVLLCGLIALFMVGGVLASVLIFAIGSSLGLPTGPMAAAFAIAVCVGAFGGPVLILLSRDYFVRRIVARAPEECWPVPLDLDGLRRNADRTLVGESDQRFVID
jgi:hypothetical protein